MIFPLPPLERMEKQFLSPEAFDFEHIKSTPNTPMNHEESLHFN